jgi:hypothetical protein
MVGGGPGRVIVLDEVITEVVEMVSVVLSFGLVTVGASFEIATVEVSFEIFAYGTLGSLGVPNPFNAFGSLGGLRFMEACVRGSSSR